MPLALTLRGNYRYSPPRVMGGLERQLPFRCGARGGNIDMADAVVVGGGIAGIASALVLRSQGHRVVVVERNERIGGLFRSLVNDSGDAFDQGTHVLCEVGVKPLDALLHPRRWQHKWRRLDVLRAGNVFRGSVNTDSPFIDVTSLPSSEHRRAVVEALECVEPPQTPASLREQLDGWFGPTITASVMEPAVQKLFGVGASELVPDAHRLFGLTRVVALSPQASRELKRSSMYDARFAYHSFRDGRSTTASYYPRRGGSESWIAGLRQELASRRVKVVVGQAVRSIEHRRREVQNLQLTDGRRLACDKLVWTIPSRLCVDAAGLENATSACAAPRPSVPVGDASAKSSRPSRLRTTTLLHVTIDRPVATDLHYVTCYDPNISFFRATFYNNLQSQRPSRARRHRITVEVLGDRPVDKDVAHITAWRELCRLRLVDPPSQVLYRGTEVIRGGFPVLTNQFVARRDKERATVRRGLRNCVLLGRANSAAWFHNDVLREIYEVLTSDHAQVKPRRKVRRSVRMRRDHGAGSRRKAA